MAKISAKINNENQRRRRRIWHGRRAENGVSGVSVMAKMAKKPTKHVWRWRNEIMALARGGMAVI
jgi:hypothetical protein